ncbi:Glycosyltransferase 6 [Apostasia shenzhenica]|uniref:Glycosyltransferase 6 n=1 Tax=Apostasia shenzhenica TaxID=1088818 RepID=A0A2I0ADK0_9ASPA|nr:Glycosyltransferase 6 [Apostasia shenzhenica]
MSPASSSSSPRTPGHSMAKPTFPASKRSILADGIVFSAGASASLLLIWVFSTFLPHGPSPAQSSFIANQFLEPFPCGRPDLTFDSSAPSFYDDPSLSYSLSDSRPLSDWDKKRRRWLRLHPSFSGDVDRVLLLTGSQPTPCRNRGGDHLLLRFFKNKVDYCRLHGIDVFYNAALLHPSMPSFWAKLPLVRAAMVAHPEAEWLWWVDSDAAITDMEFELPLSRYRSHNLVVHGWPNLIYENRSWTAINAGVFLIRNCQWSLDFLARWARLGPQNPDYARWGQILRAELPDKLFPDSDDQSALIFLLLREKQRWGDKIYLESEFYFEGYWLEIVGRLEGIAERYMEMERKEPALRRRRSEKVEASPNREWRQGRLAAEGAEESGREGWRRRPFITHFTGCQPCSGDHNEIYSAESCYRGMVKALNFADDQVLRAYGFRHIDLLNDSVLPLPFDFPVAG